MTPDSAVLPGGYTLHRADRSSDLSGTLKGSGVCFYINHPWRRDSAVLFPSCSPDVETLTIKCIPFYLPREFTSLVLVGVYMPPRANAETATSHFADLIHNIETSHPDSQILVLVGFNHAKLTKVLPKYRQQI